MAGDQYVSSVKYNAVAVWQASHAYVIGDFVRQTAPTDTAARVFRCTTAGTSGGSEPAWSTTAGATTSNGTCVFTEVTGNPTWNWSAPHLRVENALGSGYGTTTGTFIYIDSNHAYSLSGATSITWTGTAISGAGRRYLSVNAAGSVPPVAADLLAGAKETLVGNASFVLRTNYYIDGVTIILGSGQTGTCTALVGDTSATSWGEWRNGGIQLATTGASSFIEYGQTSASTANEIRWVNFTVKFGATGQSIFPLGGRWSWVGGGVDGAGSIPSTFISQSGNQPSYGLLAGLDLSALTGTVVGHASNTSTYVQFVDCKMNGSETRAAWTNGTVQATQGIVDFINCNSGSSTTDRSHHQVMGDLTRESTKVRSSGANNGVADFSWKVVTNNAPGNWTPYLNPFACPPIDVWNDTVSGNVTITLNVLNDGTTLKDNEVGFDVCYLGGSSYPQATLASSIPNVLSSGSNLSTGGSGWTTTGLSSAIQQTIAVTIAPRMAGYLRIVPKVLKASQTLYIDPKVVLS